MAVTITVQELGIELGFTTVVTGDDTVAMDGPFVVIVTDLHESVTALVEKRAPDAPEHIQNRAAVMAAGYMHDSPPGRGRSYANAWINSGAASLCAPWRSRRAERVDA